VVLLSACAAVQEATLTDRNGWTVQREFVNDGQKRVEVYWAKPAGDGPFPAIVFVHGHQETERNGGESYVRTGRLGRMAAQGYVAAAVSQPGYGNSDGPPDFCGPRTQGAVLRVVEALRGKPFVKPEKITVFGYSRGAIVTAMVATKDPRLAGVVLGAGAYDFATWFPTPMRGIEANIRQEAGTSAEAFRDRSALLHVDKITIPVLILHGAKEERIPLRQAERFAEALQARGARVKLVVFPDAGHDIPIEAQYREILPFLQTVSR
jgi:dipeptidyl aminopeptidase/acylaminoacyl peptidase